jgi:hypothetical protein
MAVMAVMAVMTTRKVHYQGYSLLNQHLISRTSDHDVRHV